jgi:hypothetical protein
MMDFIKIMFEEIFPFFSFLRNKHKKLKKVQTIDVSQEIIKEYSMLSIEKLHHRLSEEHERASTIDEKTTKFTLGLSVSLTVLSAASGTLVKLLPDNNLNFMIVFLCSLSSIFMLIAGIISLGALKTLPKYGYGTKHEILAEQQGANHIANALFLQEEINIVRHLRNESAYQCLRNGFFLLLLALITAIFLIGMPSEAKPVSQSIPIEHIEKTAVQEKAAGIVDNHVKPDKAKSLSTERSDNKANSADAKSRAAD